MYISKEKAETVCENESRRKRSHGGHLILLFCAVFIILYMEDLSHVCSILYHSLLSIMKKEKEGKEEKWKGFNNKLCLRKERKEEDLSINAMKSEKEMKNILIIENEGRKEGKWRKLVKSGWKKRKRNNNIIIMLIHVSLYISYGSTSKKGLFAFSKIARTRRAHNSFSSSPSSSIDSKNAAQYLKIMKENERQTNNNNNNGVKMAKQTKTRCARMKNIDVGDEDNHQYRQAAAKARSANGALIIIMYQRQEKHISWKIIIIKRHALAPRTARSFIIISRSSSSVSIAITKKHGGGIISSVYIDIYLSKIIRQKMVRARQK